jgi:hypothetical protein
VKNFSQRPQWNWNSRTTSSVFQPPSGRSITLRSWQTCRSPVAPPQCGHNSAIRVGVTVKRRSLRAILWRACGMTNFTHFRLRVLHAFG